jgi:ketose-bisphosphate aldolases
MALVPMGEMLVKARRQGYAVGAFEFWSLDSALAIIESAYELDKPVILQVGHFERDYMNGYRNAYRIAAMASELYPTVQVALHLDHAEEYEEVSKALDAGFTSVMIDGSMLSFKNNVELTKKVVKAAGEFGAAVEAELGQLGGIEGKQKSEGGKENQTDPDEAFRFVDMTGIEALAVSIGTAHGFYIGVPEINIERLKNIAAKVDIPLVLHGGSGTPGEKVVEAIQNGVAKVNICTEFIAAFGRRYSEVQQEPGFKYNVFSLFKSAKDTSKELVKSKMNLFSPTFFKP